MEFDRFNSCLELFLDELELEESERNKEKPHKEEPHHEKLSDLMRKSLSDGKFWFHELIYDSFTGPDNSAWKAICDIQPSFEDLALMLEPDGDEFVERKMKQLAAYKAECIARGFPVEAES